jgi:hypothetical protein
MRKLSRPSSNGLRLPKRRSERSWRHLCAWVTSLLRMERRSCCGAPLSRSMDQPDDFVSEDDCVVCRGWPPVLRPSMRMSIDTLPLQVEQICDGCLLAFWGQLRHRAPSWADFITTTVGLKFSVHTAINNRRVPFNARSRPTARSEKSSILHLGRTIPTRLTPSITETLNRER